MRCIRAFNNNEIMMSFGSMSIPLFKKTKAS